MKPITRTEMYLAYITEEFETIPERPITRVEFYLSAIAGENTTLPDRPITRVEMYLARIAGQSVSIPDKPITRIEMYLAAIAGQGNEVPVPITGVEMYLATWAEQSGGTIKTVTGLSPLALVNALAKPIKKLIQYGKVATVDGDSYCNNGKLVAIDDELPAGYKRLIGITFDGNFRYETGEYLTGDDDVTMTLNNLASSGKNVFGSYNGANDKNFSLYIYGSTSGSYFRYGDQLKRPKYGGTGQRTITFGKSGTSGFADDSDVTPDEFTTPANTYIGMLPNSTSAAYIGDIVGSILVSNRLKWIPCERETDGVLGYYEKFNRNFLEPVGSGTPVSLGYDTSHLTVLTVVGTPEVLSVEANLYDASTNVVGYYLHGTGAPNENPDPTNSYSAAIPVEAGKKYTFTGVSSKAGSNNKRIIAYSSDANPTASLKVGAAVAVPVDGIGVPYSVSIDLSDPQYANAKYIRFSLNTADTNVVCIEEGSEQTASVVNLFSTGTVHDEQDIISGVVTRRTEVSVSDGEVTISALAEPVTERVTAQPLRTAEGSNTVSVVSEVGNVELTVEYMGAE